MTWGEIQVRTLEKMFAKDTPITVSDLSNLRNDDDTKWYLSAMRGVANEAIQRIKPRIMNMYEKELDEDDKWTGNYVKTTIDTIEANTADSYELDIPEDALVLLPLYMASELYKDDDISLSTQYRNEFEAGLQDLYYNIEPQDSIMEVF